MRFKVLGFAAFGFLTIASQVLGQVTYQWSASDPSNWNMDENWMDGGNPAVVPDFGFAESAEIGNGGTAIVDSDVPDIEDLTVSNGVLDVQNNGALSMLFGGIDTGGRITIGSSGRVQVSGNGSLTTERGATNDGTLALTGGTATVQIGGDFTNNGTLEANITGATHSAVQVTGTANLGGTVKPIFNGVTPGFGDSWDVVTAGTVNGSFDSVDTSQTPGLPLGLRLDSIVDGNTAKLQVNNALLLTVDRATGNMSISNPVGGDIEFTGYTIESANGLLNAGGFSGLQGAGQAGWVSPTTNAAEHIGELNLEQSTSLAVAGSHDIGSGYAPGPQSPTEEDLVFNYLAADGNIFPGIIKYEGPANDLVLNIDTATGAAAISNLSSFITPPEITGYSILSESGSLNDSFTGLSGDETQAGPGWEKANPAADHLAELNLENTSVFNNGTIAMLGNAFAPGGTQDLVFQYSTLAGDFLMGTVQYDGIPTAPPTGLAADFNKDGMVDLQDFNILKGNFGSSSATMADGDANMDGNVNLEDFNILKGQFGQSGSAAVPEPGTFALAFLGLIGACVVSARRRISSLSYAVVAVAAVCLAGGTSVSNAQTILFHGADVDPTFGADGAVFDFLVQKLGDGNVTYMQGDMAAGDGSSASGFSAVVISSSLGSGTVRNKYEDSSLPVLNWEQALTDSSEAGDFQLSATGRTQASSSQIDIVDSGHFITGGFTGTIDVVTSPQTFSLGVGDVGAGVQVLANLAGSPADHAIMVAEPGEALNGDGSAGRPDVAPARRAFLFLEDNSFTELTPDGLEIFDRTIDWILGVDLGEFTAGDFNSDGVVDLGDFEIMRTNFNEEFSFQESFSKGDNNRDRRVDLQDFIEFREIFNSQGAAAAVPEPSGLILAGIGLAGTLYFAGRAGRASRKSRHGDI